MPSASLVLFFNGWQVFVNGQWDTSTFVTSYFPIVSLQRRFFRPGLDGPPDQFLLRLSQWFFPVLYGFYRFIWRRDEKGPTKAEMDFVSGSREEQFFVDQELPEPKGLGRRILAYVL